MAITEFADHFCAYLKEVHLSHRGRELGAISLMYAVPPESALLLLVAEETVVLVQCVPERLQITTRRIVISILRDAGGESRQ